jgi:hypothetical protein
LVNHTIHGSRKDLFLFYSGHELLFPLYAKLYKKQDPERISSQRRNFVSIEDLPDRLITQN